MFEPEDKSIELLVTTPGLSAVAKLSFPAPQVVVLSLYDLDNNEMPCSDGKAQYGSAVKLSCTLPTGDVMEIAGSVL